MPRRLLVLLAVFGILLTVCVGVYALRSRRARQREARWDAMTLKAQEYTAQNPINPTTDQPPPKAPAAKIVAGVNAVLEPVHFLWKPSENTGRMQNVIDGCLPIAPHADLVWHDNDLFVMTMPGRLERIWPEGASDSPSSYNNVFVGRRHCFDGRFVWVFDAGWPRRLMVIDPLERRSWEFGSEATGLFRRSTGQVRVGLAPVEPGVVCALIGTDEPSLAILRFNPDDNEREVETIDLPQTVAVAASPEQMFSLEAEVGGEKVRRVVIGRDMLPHLLVDPDNGRISLAAPNSLYIAHRMGHWCVYQGAVWWQRKAATSDNHTTLMRATLPELKEEAVLSGVPSALLLALDDGLLLVGRECWKWSGSGAEISTIQTGCPWTFKDQLVMPAEAGSVPAAGVIFFRFDNSTVSPSGKPFDVDDLFRPATAAPGRSVFRPAAIFRSSIYGLLTNTLFYTQSPGRLCQIDIEDAATDVALVERASDVAGRRKPRVTASRLTLATLGDTAQEPLRVALLDAAVEPLEVGPHDRLPVLAREIVRQSLLLAAWTELGCAIADGALGESLADAAQAKAELRLTAWFHDDGSGQAALERVNDQGATEGMWQQDIRFLNGQSFDYRLLTEAAESWSRGPFAGRLRDCLPRHEQPGPFDDNADEAAAAHIERELSQMTFPAQFSAVRRSSRQVAHGARGQGLGRLVRAYANLGLLTDHHWTLAHKTFQARALLLSQRMIADTPQSPAGYWHRAYALALAGVPGAALDDLARADRLASEGDKSRGRPPWVEVIAANCRFDGAGLAAMSHQEAIGPLAALLRFLWLARLHGPALKRNSVPQPGERPEMRYYEIYGAAVTTRAALDVVEREPRCDRAYDAMSDCCDVEYLRESTANALSVFERTFPERLRAMDDLPVSVLSRLDAAAEGSPMAELAQALASVPEVDESGLSWQALGALVRETLFLQCWRRAHLLRFEAKEKTDPFLKEIEPRVAFHPFRRLFDFYLDRDDDDMAKRADEVQKAAAQELVAQIRLSTLTETQWRLFAAFFSPTWEVERPDDFAAAMTRIPEHDDDVLRDLLERIDLRKRIRRLPDQHDGLEETFMTGPPWALDTAREINAISPGNPDAVATALRADPVLARKLFTVACEKYRGQPQIFRALTMALYPNDPRAYEALAEYVKLSPDAWAYRMLARFHFEQGRKDAWQAVLDEYLSKAGDDPAANDIRIEMVHYLANSGQAQKALPYALAAAADDSVLGIGAVIRCYENLGEEEQEGTWRERLFERDKKSYNARELYLWCRRTGRGDARLWAQRTAELMQPNDVYQQGVTQVRLGAFYWLSGKRPEALSTYQIGMRITNDPIVGAFCNLCSALVAQEMGDAASRDFALVQNAGQFRRAMPYEALSKWMSTGFSAKKLDVQTAEKIAATAPTGEITAINFLLGYALLLVGQRQDAMPFLKVAATSADGAGSTSRLLAIVALRDGRLAAEN